jgi:hypothetical protein
VAHAAPLVAIRAHFEKFPATVKGAFVLQSADRDPHQVVIRAARVAELGGTASQPIELQPVTIDVAPKLDFFVPFEFPVTELGAGWYCLETDVDVDAMPQTIRPERRFAVPWPRATVRRGSVPVGRTVALEGGPTVHVDRVECGGDSIKVHFTADPAEPVELRLRADGDRLAVLETQLDEGTGAGKATAYPLLKSQTALTVEVAHKRSKAAVEVALP